MKHPYIGTLMLPKFSDSFDGFTFRVTLPIRRGVVQEVEVVAVHDTDYVCTSDVIVVHHQSQDDLRDVIEFGCIEAALRWSQPELLVETKQVKRHIDYSPLIPRASGWR